MPSTSENEASDASGHRTKRNVGLHLARCSNVSTAAQPTLAICMIEGAVAVRPNLCWIGEWFIPPAPICVQESFISPSIASFLSTQRLTDRESPLWLLHRLKVGPWREPGGRGSTWRRCLTTGPQVHPPATPAIHSSPLSSGGPRGTRVLCVLLSHAPPLASWARDHPACSHNRPPRARRRSMAPRSTPPSPLGASAPAVRDRSVSSSYGPA